MALRSAAVIRRFDLTGTSDRRGAVPEMVTGGCGGTVAGIDRADQAILRLWTVHSAAAIAFRAAALIQ
jgi:hypothetical protein